MVRTESIEYRGAYRIAFRQWDPASDACLFEVRELHEDGGDTVVLVWGVPTPEEAAELLRRHGVARNGAAPNGGSPAGPDSVPVVHAGRET